MSSGMHTKIQDGHGLVLLPFFPRRVPNRATLRSRRWVASASLHTWAGLRICNLGHRPSAGSAGSGHQRSSCRCALRSVASLSSEPADSGTPACPALMGASAAAPTPGEDADAAQSALASSVLSSTTTRQTPNHDEASDAYRASRCLMSSTAGFCVWCLPEPVRCLAEPDPQRCCSHP